MNKEIVLSQEEILKICSDIGSSLTKELEKEERVPVVVGVLKGALNFMMDLIKYIDCPIYTDFIQIKSYSGTTSTGKIQMIKDIGFDCENKTVVIVEDVVDTGLSMDFLIKRIKSQNPKRIIVVALFDKVISRVNDVKVDYAGKVLTENGFLYGYGLDYNEIGRNIPYVYIISKEEINSIDELVKNDN